MVVVKRIHELIKFVSVTLHTSYTQRIQIILTKYFNHKKSRRKRLKINRTYTRIIVIYSLHPCPELLLLFFTLYPIEKHVFLLYTYVQYSGGGGQPNTHAHSQLTYLLQSGRGEQVLSILLQQNIVVRSV